MSHVFCVVQKKNPLGFFLNFKYNQYHTKEDVSDTMLLVWEADASIIAL
jgi:hypothetical protein